jgi:GntR family transcriptional regulator, N-acetylglucosamine utilization regulator
VPPHPERESEALSTPAGAGVDWSAHGLDRRSPVPFYYQLQEILKQALEHGRWAPGELLPSEAELESAFGVSRTVIRKALDVLEGDGQIYRVKGKGSVVAPPKFRYEAVAAAQQWMRHDIDPGAVLWKLIHVSSVPGGGYLARVLGLAPTDEVWELVFVSAVGGVPVSLSQMYLRHDASEALDAASRAAELPTIVVDGSDVLGQLQERYGLRLRESDITVESTKANEFEADQLGIGHDTPVFLLSMRSTSATGVPVAFTRTVVRSDHFRFSVAIRHEAGADGSTLQPLLAPVRDL